jgi:AraC-type DNA-binding domain-containing proteins
MNRKKFVRFSLHERSVWHNFNSSDLAKNILAYADSCGRFITTPEYYEDRSEYCAPMIMYVFSGSFFYCADEKITRVNAGELAIFDTTSAHIYGTDESSDFIWLHIAGNGITKIIQELLYQNKSNVFRGDVIIPARDFLNYMQTICSENLQIPESEVSVMIYKSLYSLFPNIQNETFTANYDNKYILDSIEFIRKNYHRKITVKDIAAHVHLSEAHFSRLFRAETGISPYSYLIEHRINTSKLLLEKGFSITETAQRTGWSSDSNFIYAFKQSTGVPPGGYVKK